MINFDGLRDIALFIGLVIFILAFSIGYWRGSVDEIRKRYISVNIHDENTAKITYTNGKTILLDVNTMKTREVDVQ